MEINKITTGDYKIFTVFALFWIFLAWLGFLSALVGFFYSWIFIGYFILEIAGTIYVFRKKIFNKPSGEFCIAALVFLAIVILFSSFTIPTIFSGRDQGSISEAGIRLAQNHQLKFSTPASQEFFKIYGPGKALNFPGFHYAQSGELITQFPIPYIAWLGIFYSVFGLAGLIIANAVLFYLFLFSAYLLFRLFAPIKYSVIFLLLLLISFSFSWFLKFTLSENMALALIWLGILQLVLFFKEKSNLYFFSFLTTLGLMAFTRIEGVALLTMLIIIMLFNKSARNFLAADKVKRIFFPVFIFVVIFILNFIVNFSFFREIGKALLKNSTQTVEVSSIINTANILLVYGIVPYLIFGIIGIVYFIKRKTRLEFLPLVLVFPLLFYLADPHISSDHPWMLRRYVFAILPLFIFYTVLWLAYYFRNKKRWLLSVILAILFLLNITASLKYFTFSENKNLLEQTKILSQNFSTNDLILVDRLASGDGWSMLSGPMSFLHGKNTVYFFNPNDLSKINLEKFDKIYLIAPDEKISFYESSILKSRLNFCKDYQIETLRLKVFDKNEKNILLPEKKIIKIEGKIFEVRN